VSRVPTARWGVRETRLSSTPQFTPGGVAHSAAAGPNRGTRPRMVQYVNMFPTRIEEHEEWI
jgi:hypothetical protein